MDLTPALPRPSAARCAYCHAPAAGATRCPACSTLLHEECASLAGGCVTLGCAARADHVRSGKPERPRAGWLAAGVLALLLAACVLGVLGVRAAFLLNKPWTQRLAERIDPDDLRRDCDRLMADALAHGSYESPDANFPDLNRRRVDMLPASLRDLDPHHVRVEPDHVWVEWDGEVMTSFGLVVVRDPDAQPNVYSRPSKRLFPRIWAYVD